MKREGMILKSMYAFNLLTLWKCRPIENHFPCNSLVISEYISAKFSWTDFRMFEIGLHFGKLLFRQIFTGFLQSFISFSGVCERLYEISSLAMREKETSGYVTINIEKCQTNHLKNKLILSEIFARKFG